MTDRRSRDDRCTLCGTALAGSAVEADAGERFCSSGCRDVAALYGSDADEADADSERPRSDGTVRTFLRVDGMHSATCEAYLESVAEAEDGVVDAAASYVTETVRVDHDPDRVSPAALEATLTTTGYTAYRRDEAAAADGETGGTRRSREVTGMRKRRADDVFEMRYVVGVVFGSFLLLPYVAVLYPVYLSSFADWGMLALFGEAFTGLDEPLFLSAFFVLTGIVLYLTGMPLLRGAYVGLKMRRPNAALLAALTIVGAYAYGTLAGVTGGLDVYYDLTVAVAAVVMAASFYEATAKRRATDRLTDLTVSQVDEARLYDADGTTATVPVEEVAAGDRVLVRRGERVPVDGTLAEGSCTVDEAVVTGESLPVAKEAGDAVVGGSVVTDGAAVVDAGERTTSSIDRLTRAVWDVQSADHGVQRRADDLASRLAPLVVGAAVVVGAGTLALGADPTAAAMASLLTLVVASPWGLGFAASLSVAASIEEAVERGLVVFDETVFERLRAVDVVVFDKTGTLTAGRTEVLEADAPADLLRAAAALEERASHPAAEAIASAFAGEGTRADGGSLADDVRVCDFRSHATGVEGVVDGRRTLVGHPDLFAERGWTVDEALERRVADARGVGRLPVVVGRDGAAEGVVVVGDEPRAGWEETVTSLHESGREVVVLTGDDEAAADAFARHPAVDRVFAGVPPDGKTAAVRRLRAGNRVAMVGDGTNDAPALAAADLGISLGGGTALAADAADLAIVDDDLAAVERAFALSAAAGERLDRNLRLAGAYNAVAIPAALLGVLNPLVAMVGVVATGALVAASAWRPLLEE
ncbi:heavy metal translocating P-type ATPase [Salinilacihabitans rarus]|uniref:heavy metal translocating P-type ATPase n=1 Tax=Salinilacihabitans rarus TaxID=2961596 RepID=UPI0020C863B7|nr:heavy metal translocating P-type ATPase [Salinilacihabitans rarus]